MFKTDLCVSGASYRKLIQEYGKDAVAPYLHLIRVYARMAPDEKEGVLSLLNSQGHTTLMCGDGANDVGALKQVRCCCKF